MSEKRICVSYEILSACTLQELKRKVNAYINDGYEPVGDLKIIDGGWFGDDYCMQPVAKYKTV
jgi:hypothetical protein